MLPLETMGRLELNGAFQYTSEVGFQFMTFFVTEMPPTVRISGRKVGGSWTTLSSQSNRTAPTE